MAVTITIGGVTAPRHARTVPEILARAQDALHAARAKRHGSFIAYQPNVERDALRRDSVRATDEIVAALNERRIALAYEPVVEAQNRKAALLRMPDARRSQPTAASRTPTRSSRWPNGSGWCACSTTACSNWW